MGVILESIPLEDNQDWWWYKAKSNTLNLILNSAKMNKDLKILEIGPGKGNNLNTLSKYGEIDILESDLNFIKFIKASSTLAREAYTDFDEITKTYDLIVLLDVVEHIENTSDFFNSINRILSKEGHIVISVPAYESLWSQHDVRLKHFRRYTWQTLLNEVKDYEVVKRIGFNYLLLPIRYLQIKFSKNISTTNENSNLMNIVLFQISKIEHLLRILRFNPKFGISLFVLLKKNSL
jgi:SAM-dependent methyltransferase